MTAVVSLSVKLDNRRKNPGALKDGHHQPRVRLISCATRHPPNLDVGGRSMLEGGMWDGPPTSTNRLHSLATKCDGWSSRLSLL